jgi:hypothetical protein
MCILAQHRTKSTICNVHDTLKAGSQYVKEGIHVTCKTSEGILRRTQTGAMTLDRRGGHILKTIACLIAAVLLNHLESNAHPIKHYGLKVCGTLAGQSFDYSYLPGVDTKRRLGFNMAAFAEWSVLPAISVITQIEYTQRGMGQDQLVFNPGTLWNRVDYMSLPVLAKLTYETEPIAPFILIGPRFDYLIGFQSDEGLFNNVYQSFRKTLLGVSVGIGAHTSKIVDADVSLEMRYNFDLQYSYKARFLNVRNDSFDLWVGWGI